MESTDWSAYISKLFRVEDRKDGLLREELLYDVTSHVYVYELTSCSSSVLCGMLYVLCTCWVKGYTT
jgi:hypothetical protein